MMLFSVLHFPCGTTLLTIFKETGSYKWTAAAALITTFTAVLICFLVYRGAVFLNLL
jgi:ferrous iron transport protein B